MKPLTTIAVLMPGQMWRHKGAPLKQEKSSGVFKTVPLWNLVSEKCALKSNLFSGRFLTG